MTSDFSNQISVRFSKPDYVDDLLGKVPKDLYWSQVQSPAATHLFDVNPNAEKLNDSSAELFYVELVGINDTISLILWVRLFFKAQGF